MIEKIFGDRKVKISKNFENRWSKSNLQVYNNLDHILTLSTCPILLGFELTVFGSKFLRHNQFLDVIITFFNYDIKKLIMMQKLLPRTVSSKPNKIGHVDRIIACL